MSPGSTYLLPVGINCVKYWMNENKGMVGGVETVYFLNL